MAATSATSAAVTMRKSLVHQFRNLKTFPGQPCAKAGTQGKRRIIAALGSRFRGNRNIFWYHRADPR
jgi:hypothetical protein